MPAARARSGRLPLLPTAAVPPASRLSALPRDRLTLGLCSPDQWSIRTTTTQRPTRGKRRNCGGSGLALIDQIARWCPVPAMGRFQPVAVGQLSMMRVGADGQHDAPIPVRADGASGSNRDTLGRRSVSISESPAASSRVEPGCRARHSDYLGDDCLRSDPRWRRPSHRRTPPALHLPAACRGADSSGAARSRAPAGRACGA